MLTKDLLNIIALNLDLRSLYKFQLACKNFVCGDEFWRTKLLRLGMKDVSKENVEDPREAYKQILLNQEERNTVRILEAAHNGDIYPIKYLLEQGCQLKDSALQEASYYGHLEIVKYLVEQKADIHYNNDLPLRYAVHSGHLNVVKYLVEQGADIYKPSAKEYNSIELARFNKHTEIIQYFESIKMIKK